uniref:Uncharacterized protein n=1 Tax=Caenorhabditis japonica TaxID=281687 RepID=A0A8R1IFZ2_CAEJA
MKPSRNIAAAVPYIRLGRTAALNFTFRPYHYVSKRPGHPEVRTC